MAKLKQHNLGFYQLDPIPTEANLNQFYRRHYYDLLRKGSHAPEIRKLLDVGGEREPELLWLKATLHEDIADLILDFAPKKGAVLDVGCGSGDLILSLKEKGIACIGLEPSEAAAQIAHGRGVQALCSTLGEWVAQTENHNLYRAITLVNVLEHVPDPIATLENIMTMLRPGGVLVFRVPNDFTELQEIAQGNCEKKQWWLAEPDHINYFKAESARTACAQAGLDVVDNTADFPMELFILMNINYIDNPALGSQAHQMRRNMEMTLPKKVRRKMYHSLADLGMGRNILVTAQKV